MICFDFYRMADVYLPLFIIDSEYREPANSIEGEYLHVLNTLHHNFIMYILFCSLYISKGTDEENFFNSEELLLFMIISFILMTVMCDSGLIL